MTRTVRPDRAKRSSRRQSRRVSEGGHLDPRAAAWGAYLAVFLLFTSAFGLILFAVLQKPPFGPRIATESPVRPDKVVPANGTPIVQDNPIGDPRPDNNPHKGIDNIREFRHEEEIRINEYAVQDGLIHIPLDRAMELGEQDFEAQKPGEPATEVRPTPEMKITAPPVELTPGGGPPPPPGGPLLKHARTRQLAGQCAGDYSAWRGGSGERGDRVARTRRRPQIRHPEAQPARLPVMGLLAERPARRRRRRTHHPGPRRAPRRPCIPTGRHERHGTTMKNHILRALRVFAAAGCLAVVGRAAPSSASRRG